MRDRPQIAVELAPRLPATWQARVATLSHAFQPIVNVHTGFCYGYEALLRGTDAAGFASIQAFFDAAHARGVLAAVEIELWERAISAFVRVPHYTRMKLFCNADNRGALAAPGTRAATLAMLEGFGLHPSSLCLEISEHHRLESQGIAPSMVDGLQRAGFKLAVDDFGRGYSGLELLYTFPSDFVKIDRFFVAGIERDRQKRVLAETMIKLAHVLGRFVVAEGIETESEFQICRDLGCDLVQGYLIQRPTDRLEDLLDSYDVVPALVDHSRRRRADAHEAIAPHLAAVPTVQSDSDLHDVLSEFGRIKNQSFLVVIDSDQRPIGLVREQDLKGYLYNPFGRDLLANASFRMRASRIVTRCPIVSSHAPVEEFINAYVQDQGNEGVIVMRDMKYAGFVDSRTLLSLVSERNLAQARDQNPLTRLPGNAKVYEFVSHALNEIDLCYALAYFDFDNFKPFNDRFGFRQGDRALILFSEMLAKALMGEQRFVGHIGGDDFVAGARDMPFEQFCQRVRALVEKFRTDIESFYDAESRAKQRIVGVDREGMAREYPLMRVSAVILDLRAGRTAGTLDYMSALIAEGKGIAKRSAGGLHIVTVGAENPAAEAPLASDAPRSPVWPPRVEPRPAPLGAD